ncbi:mannose-1-phosphate guanylyltransferase (GDP) [gut metagenome]|uniref:Mannose-1-phosphate guanylyltransferase (GDP) n=1 Tax=gut metagenome TaxID=749906 RepID=J9DCX2_9ZZZZ
MNTNNNHLVIMAGGEGSRFWPVSTSKCPKQFLDVLGCGKTLIQLTADRFKGIVPPENIWVATSKEYLDLVKEQLPEIPTSNILLEPCRRNTAPCICYVSWKIKKRNPRANVIVTPSDHMIVDVKAFQEAITDCMEFSAETDAIVTLGIRPTHPETAYGYINADLSFSSSRKRNIFRVDSFKEKPNLELAEQYVKQNNFFWNSGIFIWSVSTIVNAFRVYEPEISHNFEDIFSYYDTPQEQDMINQQFPKCENISVDYAIMEKAEEIFIYPAEFGWSDLGTWGSLRRKTQQDEYGNAKIGNNIDVYETYNSIIHTTGLKKVVVQGLDGYIVVERDGTLLICKLSEEQRIKLFH